MSELLVLLVSSSESSGKGSLQSVTKLCKMTYATITLQHLVNGMSGLKEGKHRRFKNPDCSLNRRTNFLMKTCYDFVPFIVSMPP